MLIFSQSFLHPWTTFGGSIRRAAKAGSRFMRCYCRYLQRRDLAELDDHLLRDIGLTREQVDAECRKPFWR